MQLGPEVTSSEIWIRLASQTCWPCEREPALQGPVSDSWRKLSHCSFATRAISITLCSLHASLCESPYTWEPMFSCAFLCGFIGLAIRNGFTGFHPKPNHRVEVFCFFLWESGVLLAEHKRLLVSKEMSISWWFCVREGRSLLALHYEFKSVLQN